MNIVPSLVSAAHPPGEPSVIRGVGHIDTFPVTTAGGVFHVRFDPNMQVSALGGMVPFAQFLQVSGLFDGLVADAPLSYASNHAPDVRDVLGTSLLSILSGHYRFAHAAALRGDTVTPSLLGMKRVVSEDSVRRGLKRLVESPEKYAATDVWLSRHLQSTLNPLMSTGWIMDMDVTVKPTFGYQPGSVVGYNPQKPGRPSHALHTFMMARTRLVLDVMVHPGNEHSSKSTLPDFQRVMSGIPRALWPLFVRGDCGFGTEEMMAWPEANGLHYLFKQRMTSRTRAMVNELDLTNGWAKVVDTWEAKESTLQLTTWSRARRVVVLRRISPGPRYLRAKDLAAAKQPKQMVIDTCEPYLVDDAYEYQVLVTSLTDNIPTIVQWYRDRADSENIFDEIKNHWGWGGFTSHTFAVTQVAARIVALIYNWWSIFCRIADPDHHREAITTRPTLLHSIVRQTTSGGQRTLTITSTNRDKNAIATFFTKLSAWFTEFSTTAEQWTAPTRWTALLKELFSGTPDVLRMESG